MGQGMTAVAERTGRQNVFHMYYFQGQYQGYMVFGQGTRRFFHLREYLLFDSLGQTVDLIQKNHTSLQVRCPVEKRILREEISLFCIKKSGTSRPGTDQGT